MTDQRIKHRRGCLFYGCITSFCLLALLLVAGLVSLKFAKKLLDDFTDTKPAALPEVRLSSSEIDAVQARIEKFRTAVNQGQSTEPLAVTADEINALIETDPDLKTTKGMIHTIIEGDRLKGQLSIPMERIGLTQFQGRYLNGTGTFNLQFNDGKVRLTAQSLVVKGKPVPEVYMEQIRKHNLVTDLNSDPRAQAALKKLEAIKIDDGKLVIVPK